VRPLCIHSVCFLYNSVCSESVRKARVQFYESQQLMKRCFHAWQSGLKFREHTGVNRSEDPDMVSHPQLTSAADLGSSIAHCPTRMYSTYLQIQIGPAGLYCSGFCET
jgi:hypothetical protein